MTSRICPTGDSTFDDRDPSFHSKRRPQITIVNQQHNKHSPFTLALAAVMGNERAHSSQRSSSKSSSISAGNSSGSQAIVTARRRYMSPRSRVELCPKKPSSQSTSSSSKAKINRRHVSSSSAMMKQSSSTTRGEARTRTNSTTLISMNSHSSSTGRMEKRRARPTLLDLDGCRKDPRRSLSAEDLSEVGWRSDGNVRQSTMAVRGAPCLMAIGAGGCLAAGTHDRLDKRNVIRILKPWKQPTVYEKSNQSTPDYVLIPRTTTCSSESTGTKPARDVSSDGSIQAMKRGHSMAVSSMAQGQLAPYGAAVHSYLGLKRKGKRKPKFAYDDTEVSAPHKKTYERDPRMDTNPYYERSMKSNKAAGGSVYSPKALAHSQNYIFGSMSSISSSARRRRRHSGSSITSLSSFTVEGKRVHRTRRSKKRDAITSKSSTSVSSVHSPVRWSSSSSSSGRMQWRAKSSTSSTDTTLVQRTRKISKSSSSCPKPAMAKAISSSSTSTRSRQLKASSSKTSRLSNKVDGNTMTSHSSSSTSSTQRARLPDRSSSSSDKTPKQSSSGQLFGDVIGAAAHSDSPTSMKVATQVVAVKAKAKSKAKYKSSSVSRPLPPMQKSVSLPKPNWTIDKVTRVRELDISDISSTYLTDIVFTAAEFYAILNHENPKVVKRPIMSAELGIKMNFYMHRKRIDGLAEETMVTNLQWSPEMRDRFVKEGRDRVFIIEADLSKSSSSRADDPPCVDRYLVSHKDATLRKVSTKIVYPGKAPDKNVSTSEKEFRFTMHLLDDLTANWNHDN